ncbi:capsule assembly Wzi family protein [Vibrio astriarenae]|uniref:capsule assembly Wzi family protein n=1 Tax=Vibrio astriarenae TaxID=1481923 RepID=UPI0037366E38
MRFNKGLSNRTKLSAGMCFATILVSLPATASPWLESNDPFLRSSLHKLSDNYLLLAPMSSYPLRWSTLGDDIKTKHSDASVRYAVQHLRHAMNNAQFSRGNVMAKAIYQSTPQAHLGFGDNGTDKWGIYSSYDHLDDDFSFRLSINYADSPQPSAALSGSDSKYDTDVNFRGSHLSFNLGFGLVSLGYLERWWGPSWQHNVQQASFGETSPSLQLSWVGEQLPVLGFWNFDTVVDYIDQEASYVWSNRFIAKPHTAFEFGLNYQLSDEDKSDSQLMVYGIDGRLTLPKFQGLSHAVFANYQHVELDESTSTVVYGWEGHLHAWGTEITIVLEGQSVDEQDVEKWSGAQQRVLNDRTSTLWGDSYSLAFYGQLPNDHRISVVGRDSQSDRTHEKASQIDYHIPFQQGMFSFGLGYVDYASPNKTIDEPNFAFGYEYRY